MRKNIWMGLALCVWTSVTLAAAPAVTVDNKLLADEADGRSWAAYGRTFGEGHYSPLTQINDKTVQRLGLAWSLDLDVTNMQTTPLAVDGVVYLAAGYSIVHAVDARSGKLLCAPVGAYAAWPSGTVMCVWVRKMAGCCLWWPAPASWRGKCRR